MAKTHDLKCWPGPFQALWDGTKTAEWRKNDRNYQVGDILHQQEWDPNKVYDYLALMPYAHPGVYTGRSVDHLVTHAVYGPAFGIPEGYVMMSLKPVNVRTIEGKCEVDGDADGITMVTIDNEDVYNFLWVTGCDGKRVRLTVEVLEGEKSDA